MSHNLTVRVFKFSILGLGVLLTPLFSAESTSTAPGPWGPPSESGLKMRIVSPAIRAYHSLRLTLQIHNPSSTAVPLPWQRNKPQIWFLAAQSSSSPLFSKRYPLTLPKSLPSAVPPQTTIAIPFMSRQLEMFLLDNSVKLKGAYPAPVSPEKPPKSRGDLLWEMNFASKITIGTCACWGTMSSKERILAGNMTLQPLPPEQNLSGPAKEHLLKRIRNLFHKNATTAMQASAMAVAAGDIVFPTVAQIFDEPNLPEPNRAWIIATLCQFDHPNVHKVMIEYLKKPKIWFGTGYHIARLHSPQISAEVAKRAAEKKESAFIRWSIRGYVTFQKKVPPQLMQIALKSSNPQLKATAIIALSAQKDEGTIDTVGRYIDDPSPQIVTAAITALKNIRKDSPKVRNYLSQALQHPSDTVKAKACEALATLIPRVQFPLDPKNPAEAAQAWLRWLRSH